MNAVTCLETIRRPDAWAHAMIVTVRSIGVLLGSLVCGHAMGQDVGNHESLLLHGVAMRMIAEEQTPLQPRLRLYVDTRSGMRFGGLSALPERAPRIAVEFKLAPSLALVAVHGTLLRTNLSESTHLSLRVRRHGVGIALGSEF